MNAQFVVFPARTATTPPPHYVSAYQTYRTIWDETFRSIHGQTYVPRSNDFTRQDYI